MTIRLFNKIAASLNHRLYPPPELLTGSCQHVHILAGRFLLNNGNEEDLYSVGAYIGVCFKWPQANELRSGLLGGISP